jgi:hypothetical protein
MHRRISTPHGGFHGDCATRLGRLPTPEGKPFVIASYIATRGLKPQP